MAGEAIFPLNDPDGVVRLPSWAGLQDPKARDLSGSKKQTLERARRKVEQVMMDAERERIRRQLETYCTVEPNGAANRAGALAWEYEASQGKPLNSEPLDLSEPPQAAGWRRISTWFSEPSEQEQTPQGDFSAATAEADGNHQQQAAVAENNASQSIVTEPEASRGRGYFAAVSAPDAAAGAAIPDRNTPWLEDVLEQGNGFGRRVLVTPPPKETVIEMEQQSMTMQKDSDLQFGTVSARMDGAVPQVSMSTMVPEADMQQGMRERINSRWFGLKDLVGNASAPTEVPVAPEASRVPVLAVFSLAGGAGKTSLSATLARTLSSRGERVLLLETTAHGLLPYFFGARDRRSGEVRTFRPPASSTDAPLQILSADSDAVLADTPEQGQFPTGMAESAQRSSRVIIDVPTAATETARRIQRMSPMILVPMIPDMNSVLSAGSIESIFRSSGESSDKPLEVYYVLNQFDPSLPLHLDVREALRERLGDRLLPFTLRRASAVSEALAEGMTVIDYAPESQAAEDFNLLGEWLKAVAAPANVSLRGMRWSES